MLYSATKIGELMVADGAESVLSHCVAALEKSPSNASLHHVYGRALNNVGRLEEALDELSQAIGIESDNPLMLAHRGHILAGLQRVNEAAEDFR